MMAINVNGLSKRFGRVEALKEVSFSVPQGETVVLWGSNGAGKTTILRCLLGVLAFDGALQVSGFDVSTQGKQVRSHIGYVPQEIRLHQDQSVWETVSFYARLRRIKTDRAKELLREWDLSSAQKQSVNHLSGGMKQKLALIIALLSDPPILFLDESTSHLDLKTRHEFVSQLSKLQKSGKTILLCSHRLSEVCKLADRVIVLEQGRKLKEGRSEEIRALISDTAILSLTVGEQNCKKAAELIHQRGFEVTHNETCLWVEIPVARKSEPLQLLYEKSIPVLDFELEDEVGHDEDARG